MYRTSFRRVLPSLHYPGKSRFTITQIQPDPFQRRMATFSFDKLTLPPTSDFHVHLRQDHIMRLVTPTIPQGGTSTVYVMPNTIPPITTVKQALDYQSELQKLSPATTFLMTLYLHSSITPTTIAEAKSAGIKGVKLYPAGVTTNSSSGVLDIQSFYPVFAAMQSQGLVLNLHGEVGCTCDSGPEYVQTSSIDPQNPGAVTTLNAEHAFLPTLHRLHRDFPDLKIVLEHVSTAAGLDAVRSCGSNVAGTITAHHLFLTVDDVLGDGYNFCKPVAKQPSDRVALIQEVLKSDSKFFFGSDSAPHTFDSKVSSHDGKKAAAGCFTQPYVTQLVLKALETGVEKGWIAKEDLNEHRLGDFLSRRGRAFYGLPEQGNSLVLKRGEESIITAVQGVVPVWGANQQVRILQWQN